MESYRAARERSIRSHFTMCHRAFRFPAHIRTIRRTARLRRHLEMRSETWNTTYSPLGVKQNGLTELPMMDIDRSHTLPPTSLEITVARVSSLVERPIRVAVADSILTAMILPVSKTLGAAIAVLIFVVANFFILLLGARRIASRKRSGSSADEVRIQSAMLVAWTIIGPAAVWTIVLVLSWPPPSQFWILLAAVAIVGVWQFGNRVDERCSGEAGHKE
jgi:hypothetical protein